MSPSELSTKIQTSLSVETLTNSTLRDRKKHVDEQLSVSSERLKTLKKQRRAFEALQKKVRITGIERLGENDVVVFYIDQGTSGEMVLKGVVV